MSSADVPRETERPPASIPERSETTSNWWLLRQHNGMISRSARKHSQLRPGTEAVLLDPAALGNCERTGKRSVLFRRGAAAYGDASRWLAGARTQDRAFLRGQKSKTDAKLNGAPPHSLWHYSRIFDLTGSLYSHHVPLRTADPPRFLLCGHLFEFRH